MPYVNDDILQDDIIQVKVELTGLDYSIWRRVLVRADIELGSLCQVLHVAMGWQNEYSIVLRGADQLAAHAGIKDTKEFPSVLKLSVAELLPTFTELSYAYECVDTVLLINGLDPDAPEYWEHRVVFERGMSEEPGLQYPLCTAGFGACPPSGCPAPSIYTSVMADTPVCSAALHVLEEPNEEFDPGYFDIDETNERLGTLSEKLELIRDFELPTTAQWAKLYETAKELRTLKPWAFLRDCDYIAVTPPGAEKPVYFVTFGILGEMMGIAMFRSERELYGMDRIRERAAQGVPLAALGMQDCLMCYFGDRTDLAPEDMKVIRTLNLRFRGNGQWIYFRSLKIGHAPWHICSREAESLIAALQEYSNAVVDYLSGKAVVDFDEDEYLHRRHITDETGAHPKWRYSSEKLDLQPVVPDPNIVIDELYLARLRRRGRANYEVDFDVLYMPAPVQEHRNRRPYFPRLILIMQHWGDFILEQGIARPDETLENMTLTMLERLVKENGLPRVIHVRDVEVAALVSDWCSKLGVALRVGSDMFSLNSAIYSLMGALGLDD